MIHSTTEAANVLLLTILAIAVTDPIGAAIAIVTAVFGAVGTAAVWGAKLADKLMERFSKTIDKLVLALEASTAEQNEKLDELREQVTALRYGVPLPKKPKPDSKQHRAAE